MYYTWKKSIYNNTFLRFFHYIYVFKLVYVGFYEYFIIFLKIIELFLQLLKNWIKKRIGWRLELIIKIKIVYLFLKFVYKKV